MSRLKRVVALIAGMVAVAVLAGLVAWQWFLTFEPNRARYPVRGLDVSHHQGVVDWPVVAASDVAFVYLKASEGGDHRDRRFSVNWAQARAAGLATGAYHFFTFCRSGAEQARNFIATVPRADDALPPVVDLEFGGNCGAVPSATQMRAQLDVYLAAVEGAYGKPAVLYVTPEFLAAYRDALPARKLWRRSLVRVPDGSAPWAFWQFHNRGRVAGIDGPVDLNVFQGDLRAFGAFRSGD